MSDDVPEEMIKKTLRDAARAFTPPAGLKEAMRHGLMAEAGDRKIGPAAAAAQPSASVRTRRWVLSAACAAGFLLVGLWAAQRLKGDHDSEGGADAPVRPAPLAQSDGSHEGAVAGTGAHVTGAFPVPGLLKPNQVRLDRSLDGKRLDRPVSEDGWVPIGKGLRWRCPGGKRISVTQNGPFIYVAEYETPNPPPGKWIGEGERDEPGPARLAGVRLRTPDDVATLRQALEDEPGPLTLWSDCQPPQELSRLPHLAKIAAFQQATPGALTDVSPLAGLTAVGAVDLSGCRQLIDVSSLCSMKSLETLDLSRCTSLPAVLLGGMEHLTYLNLSECINVSDVSHVGRLASLERLTLTELRWHEIDIAPLSRLKRLKHLDLRFCTRVSDIAPLAELTDLNRLNLTASRVSDFGALRGLTNLEHLELSHCDNLSELRPLAGLSMLRELDLTGCGRLSDLGPLSGLTNLQRLRLENCPGVSDLSPLAGLTNLERLDLRYCRRVSDLAPLAKLRNLTSLDLTQSQVADLSPLAELTRLEWLVLSRCVNVWDLAPLGKLQSLSTLSVSGCWKISDFSPLENIPALRARLRDIKASARAGQPLSSEHPDPPPG